MIRRHVSQDRNTPQTTAVGRSTMRMPNHRLESSFATRNRRRRLLARGEHRADPTLALLKCHCPHGRIVGGGPVVRLAKTRSRRALRSLIGYFVAYVIALQVVMSGFVVISYVTSAVVVASEICAEHGAVGGDPSGQGGHAVCPCGPACVMSTCAIIAGTPVVSIAILRPTSTIAPPHFGLELASSAPARKGSHCPRAPPPPDILAA
jgi:hypothetical protein